MKYLKSLIDIELLKNVAVFAIIYHILFNSQIIYTLYWDHNIIMVKNIFRCAYYFTYIYLGVYVIFLGLAISGIVSLVGILFLFISSSFTAYYFYIYKALPSSDIIRGFLSQDIINLALDQYNLGLLFYLWVIFCFSIIVYSIKYFKLKYSNNYSAKIISLISILVTIYNIVHPQNIIIYMSNPINYLNGIFQYYWYF